jgi:hypothetical protein
MTVLQVPSRKTSDRKGAPSCYEESQYTKGHGLERYLLCHTSLIRNSVGSISVEVSELKRKKDFIDKIASRKFGTLHSADVITELAEYRSKTVSFFSLPRKSISIEI